MSNEYLRKNIQTEEEAEKTSLFERNWTVKMTSFLPAVVVFKWSAHLPSILMVQFTLELNEKEAENGQINKGTE